MGYMKDGSGRRIDDRVLNEAPSGVAPTSPVNGQVWSSSLVRDMTVPTDPRLRQPILKHDYGWEALALQEVSTWIYGGYIWALYTAGTGGPAVAQCALTADPTLPASWTKVSTSGPVISAYLNHGAVLLDGTTLYYYANKGSTNDSVELYTAAATDPTTWTRVGSVMSLPSGSNTFGNTSTPVNDGGTWKMAVEYKVTATGRWQIGIASASSLTGTWTLITGSELLDTLWPDSDHQTAGGPQLVHEADGTWTMIYHSSLQWNGLLPSDIYRAKSSTLAGNSWTVLDGNRPFVRRVHPTYEIDQVADPEVLVTPSGVTYLFWTGMHNRNVTGSGFPGALHCAAMIPTAKRWDGGAWVNQQDAGQTTRPITEMGKPREVHKTTDWDFAGTGGYNTGNTLNTWADVPEMSVTFAPTGPDYMIRLTGKVAPTGSSGFKYQFRAIVNGDTANPYYLDWIEGTTGVRTNVNGLARVQMKTPGQYVGVKIQCFVPTGGGTLYVRPVNQPNIERLAMEVYDCAYP